MTRSLKMFTARKNPSLSNFCSAKIRTARFCLSPKTNTWIHHLSIFPFLWIFPVDMWQYWLLRSDAVLKLFSFYIFEFSVFCLIFFSNANTESRRLSPRRETWRRQLRKSQSWTSCSFWRKGKIKVKGLEKPDFSIYKLGFFLRTPLDQLDSWKFFILGK